MYPARSTCPVCASQMLVTHLECRVCGSQLIGSFELPLLSRLNAEQLHFVETMVRFRGNINRVSEELGIAYSAARGALDEIIAALGFEQEPGEAGEPGVAAEERQRILADLRDGKLKAEEALQKLRGKAP